MEEGAPQKRQVGAVQVALSGLAAYAGVAVLLHSAVESRVLLRRPCPVCFAAAAAGWGRGVVVKFSCFWAPSGSSASAGKFFAKRWAPCQLFSGELAHPCVKRRGMHARNGPKELRRLVLVGGGRMEGRDGGVEGWWRGGMDRGRCAGRSNDHCCLHRRCTGPKTSRLAIRNARALQKMLRSTEEDSASGRRRLRCSAAIEAPLQSGKWVCR